MVKSDIQMPAPSKAEEIYEASHEYRGFPICELREVFAGVADPKDFTAAWRHEVPTADVDRVKAAVHYFHADEAYVVADHPQGSGGETVEMAGNGLRRWREKSV